MTENVIKASAFWMKGKLPYVLQAWLDIVRRCPRWKKAGVLFIHVPKAAGYSVSVAIYGRALGHFYAKDVRKLCPNIFASTFTFGVVRHPADRLYSAYRFAKSGGTTVMGMENPKQYKIDAFSSFDRFVREWLVDQDLTQIDGVFRPQYLYLCDKDGKVVVDEVFKLEQVDLAIKKVSQILGRDLILGHDNRSVEEVKQDVSKETLEIIENLYQKDFEIFDYAFKSGK